MISLPKAQRIAEKVTAELAPFCHHIEIAGSIRRGKPEVGDVDLVLQVHDLSGLKRRLTERCQIARNGSAYLVAVMPDQTQLDLWFAHNPGAPGQGEMFLLPGAKKDNFGSLLLCRTGSMEHNICLARRAKRLNLHWNPHEGLFRDGFCLASATETDIYTALKLPFIEPAQREFINRSEQQRLIYADKP